jgi:hypothetical protein
MSRRDTDIHFDDNPGIGDSFRTDRGLHVSEDGARVVGGLLNVRPQKRRRRGAEDLLDVYADWTPVPDGNLEEVHAVADTVTSYDVSPEDDDDDNGKRKRYQSSVSFWFLVSFCFRLRIWDFIQ